MRAPNLWSGLILLAAAPGLLGQSKPAPPVPGTAPPAARPVIGTDVQDLIRRLIAKGAADPLSEFETQKEYDAKAAELLKSFPSTYRLIKSDNRNDFHYDAESQVMSTSLDPFRFPLTDDPCRKCFVPYAVTMKSVVTSSKKYPGTNGFGASMIITEDSIDEYGVLFAEESTVEPISASWPMMPDRAKMLKPNLRIVLSGKLTDSHVYQDSRIVPATFDNPLKLIIHKYYILVNVTDAAVLDASSGKTVHPAE